MLWDYAQPVTIRFGKGRAMEIKDIAETMGLHDGIMVTPQFFVDSGEAQRLIDASDGAVSTVFTDFSPNPDVTEVDACAEIIRNALYSNIIR